MIRYEIKNLLSIRRHKGLVVKRFLDLSLSLTCVDRRAARVISKLPLRPRRAGTRMKSWLTSTKTGQCWTMSSTMPAPTMPRPATEKGSSTCRPMDSEVSSSLDAAAPRGFPPPPPPPPAVCDLPGALDSSSSNNSSIDSNEDDDVAPVVISSLSSTALKEAAGAPAPRPAAGDLPGGAAAAAAVAGFSPPKSEGESAVRRAVVSDSSAAAISSAVVDDMEAEAAKLAAMSSRGQVRATTGLETGHSPFPPPLPGRNGTRRDRFRATPAARSRRRQSLRAAVLDRRLRFDRLLRRR